MEKFAIAAAAAMISVNVLQASVDLTGSSSAPTLGTADQYSMDTSATKLSDWPYSVTAYSDRAASSQVFTTPTGSSYTLDSFSFKGGGTQYMDSNYDDNHPTWTIKIYEVNGASFTQIASVSGIDGSAVTKATADNWFTWTFSGGDVQTLAGGAQYAVEVTSSSSYMAFASSAGDAYKGGYLDAPQTYWEPNASHYDWGYDRAFVAHLTTAVPEPTIAIRLLGLVGLGLSRNRRRA